MKVCVCLLAAFALFPAQGIAQERRGANPWGPWGQTWWDALEVRVKCEGSLPSAKSTRWRIAIRNVGDEVAYLDYDVTLDPSIEPRSRRISVQPGKSREVSAELDIDCSGRVLTRISNVRIGSDADDIPYLQPKAPRNP
jgi:hypothetical protein